MSPLDANMTITTIILLFVAWCLLGLLRLRLDRSLGGMIAMIAYNYPRLGGLMLIVSILLWPIAGVACMIIAVLFEHGR